MLSPEEWRLLAITFVGGLASIIVGACILAGAVGTARLVERLQGFSLWWLALITALAALGLALFGLLVIYPEVTSARKRRMQQRFRLFSALNTAGWAVLLTVLLLAWIGILTGIK